MRKINTLLILLSLTCFQVNAQSLLNRIAQMAMDEVEERAEEKANEGIENSLDDIEDSLNDEIKNAQKEESAKSSDAKNTDETTSDSQGSITGMMLSSMGLNSEPILVEDSYTFSISITAHMQSYDSLGKLVSEGDVISYTNPGELDYAYKMTDFDSQENENSDAFILLDFKNQASIILSESDGEKTGIVMGINSQLDSETDWEEENADEAGDAEEVEDLNFKKTGKTKKILGYSCDEYVYVDEDNTSSFWITNELELKKGEYLSGIFGSQSLPGEMAGGQMMEGDFQDKTSKEKFYYLVTDLSKNSNTKIDLSEYQITNLGNLGQ